MNSRASGQGDDADTTSDSAVTKEPGPEADDSLFAVAVPDRQHAASVVSGIHDRFEDAFDLGVAPAITDASVPMATPIEGRPLVCAIASVGIGAAREKVAYAARLALPCRPVQRRAPIDLGVDGRAGRQELVNDDESLIDGRRTQCPRTVGGAGARGEEVSKVASPGRFDDGVDDGAGVDEQVDAGGRAERDSVSQRGPAWNRVARGFEVGAGVNEGTGHVGFTVAGGGDERGLPLAGGPFDGRAGGEEHARDVADAVMIEELVEAGDADVVPYGRCRVRQAGMHAVSGEARIGGEEAGKAVDVAAVDEPSPFDLVFEATPTGETVLARDGELGHAECYPLRHDPQARVQRSR